MDIFNHRLASVPKHIFTSGPPRIPLSFIKNLSLSLLTYHSGLVYTKYGKFVSILLNTQNLFFFKEIYVDYKAYKMLLFGFFSMKFCKFFCGFSLFTYSFIFLSKKILLFILFLYKYKR